jgi:hypothetical protein
MSTCHPLHALLLLFPCVVALSACTEEVVVGRAPNRLQPIDASVEGGATDPWRSCVGAVCGAKCEPPGVFVSALWGCNAYGACVDLLPQECKSPLPAAPCAALQCGDACTLCGDRKNCFERKVPKTCDRNGACVEGAVACE